MKELIVDKKYDGKKLNSFLLNTFNGVNLNTIYKALRKKDIRVNGVRISENVIVHNGDNIKIYISDEQLEVHSEKANDIIKIDIVYEDEHICIVNKPSGIEVVGENSLTNSLKNYYNQLLCKKDKKQTSTNNAYSYIEPCHRLDRNTTGLILFAKDKTSLDILLSKFKNHEIEKHYLAKVYGIPNIKKATLTAYLFKDAKKSLVYISDIPKKGYEKIVTSYKVIKEIKKENSSILDINLHTGKTHQIRAHLAHIGYPIIGDGKYGNNEINKKFNCKTQQLESYSITFNFTTDSGILNYLKGKTVSH